MKKLFYLLLIASSLVMFNCGSVKNTSDQKQSVSDSDKIELPPNVASNKYSKKRQKY